MTRYHVMAKVTANVVRTVWAGSAEEAKEKARQEISEGEVNIWDNATDLEVEILGAEES